jgi:glucose/arabinose dehydrogenase
MTCLLIVASCPAAHAVQGLDARPQVMAYLDDAFPDATPGSGGDYSWVNAFPNLTFVSPIRMFPEPDSTRLWVIGREGHVWFFDGADPATNVKTEALDLTDVTQGRGDCGLLGFAFHPEFNEVGPPNANYVYLYYNFSLSPTQSGTPSNVISYNRLSRFEVNPTTRIIDRATEFVLVNQFDQHAWHNGGDMFFGPDGFLYFCNGDEGSANDPWNNGQSITKGLFAGVFRIDVDQQGGDISHPIRRQPIANATPPTGWPGTFTQGYYIPSNNPFVDPAGTQMEEFYALGLRSPHRMTRDPVTGKVFIGDIGQNREEEVSVLDGPGLNFQWPFREGVSSGPKSQPNPLTGESRAPLHAYGRSVGGCVIGGFVYRGTEHAGDLGGKYIFGDHNNGRIWTLDWEAGGTPVREPFLVVPPGNKWGGLSGFGIDHDNELYIMLLGTSGTIQKIVRDGGGTQPPALLSQTGAFSDLATLTPDASLVPYSINSPLWSDGAKRFAGLPFRMTGHPMAWGSA